MKQLILLASLILSTISYADIIPKRGIKSITTETRRYADGTAEIGYRLCTAGKGCSQIGDERYYDSRDLAELYKQQNLHVILSGVATPITTIVGLFLGVAVVPQSHLWALTAVAGAAGGVISYKHQKKDTAVLATTPEKNFIVSNDKEIRRLVEKLEELLSKI